MDRPEGTAAQLLGKIDEDLIAAPLWLTFHPLLERRYRAFTDVARNAHYLRVSIFGLIVYNLFLYTDWQMMPDVIELAVWLQLGLATPVCLVTLFIMRRRPALGQPVLFSTLTLLVACSCIMYGRSQTEGALLVPFSFPTIVITGNIMMPLRFNLALPFSILSGLMMTPVILLHPGYADGLQIFTLLNVLGSCACTVFAAYQMESSDRRAFLLSLRETLRAETLAHDNHHLRALAGTDGLTGIGNRRLFDAMLERLWHEALTKGEPIGLLLLDADHFKALNDRHGHQAGDRCLMLIAAILREHTRDDLDCAARYGGEEFAVLLPDSGMECVQDVAERLRLAVEAAPVALDGPPRMGALQVSIGCASIVPRQGSSPAALIEAADGALYVAKRTGRNRIHPPRGDGEIVPFRTAVRA